MANINNLTVSIELKQGIFYKLIKFKPFMYLMAILVDKFKIPYKWYLYMAVKSLKYKIGNGRWNRLSYSIIKE